MSMNINLNVRQGSLKTETVDLLQTPTAVSYSIVPRHRSEISSENLQEFVDAIEKYLAWVKTYWPDPDDAWLHEQESRKLNGVLQRVRVSAFATNKRGRVVAEFFVM